MATKRTKTNDEMDTTEIESMTDKEKEEYLKKIRILDDGKNYLQPSVEDCLMSVETWKRKTSNVEYLWGSYKLAQRVAQIVVNKPKKYQDSYGDTIIKTALNAVSYGMAANDYFISDKMTDKQFQERESYLKKAKDLTQSVMTASYIFLELHRDADGIDEKKITKEEGEIAIMTNAIVRLISAMMYSDRKRWKAIVTERDAK